jgi:hypothetical protein
MNLQLVVAVLLALTTSPSGPAKDARLEGCQDPALIAKALGELQTKDWREISLVRLQDMWPTQVRALDCHNAETCTSGWSQDRIIDGHCECCELFYFETKPAGDARNKEHLENIIIHYTAAERDEVVRAARGFAQALGMPENELRNVGRDESQDFSWMDSQKQLLSGFNVEFTHKGSKWKAYFNFSRHAM